MSGSLLQRALGEGAALERGARVLEPAVAVLGRDPVQEAGGLVDHLEALDIDGEQPARRRWIIRRRHRAKNTPVIPWTSGGECAGVTRADGRPSRPARAIAPRSPCWSIGSRTRTRTRCWPGSPRPPSAAT